MRRPNDRHADQRSTRRGSRPRAAKGDEVGLLGCPLFRVVLVCDPQGRGCRAARVPIPGHKAGTADLRFDDRTLPVVELDGEQAIGVREDVPDVAGLVVSVAVLRRRPLVLTQADRDDFERRTLLLPRVKSSRRAPTPRPMLSNWASAKPLAVFEIRPPKIGEFGRGERGSPSLTHDAPRFLMINATSHELLLADEAKSA